VERPLTWWVDGGDGYPPGEIEMRAVAFSDLGVAPEIHELPVPEPGPGEVLVRVSHSSINGFHVAVAAGMVKGTMEHRFPVVLGKDFRGIVETVGAGVTSVKEGDEVFGVLMLTT
jgi:NADPH:quinone reductase